MAKLSTTSVFGDLLVDGIIHGNVTGNLTGNASTATSATTATTAGKWTTARTITIGSKGKTVDGSGNVSWTLAEIGAAAASHGNHYLTKTLTTGFNTAFRTQTKGDANSGAYLTTIRNDTANVANSPQYGTGLAWGRGDTHGYLYMNYSSAQAFIGAGSANKLNWIKQVSFTDHTHDYAASSHGTHVTWSTTTPKANGTATVGTETKVARGDHVHPLQTSVSGNAGTATKLKTAREIKIGNTGKNFDGSANVSWTLSEIGAAASSHNHTHVNKTMITTPLYNADTGTLVDFNLNEKSGAMVILKLYGNSYSSNPPIEAIYQFYDYSGGNIYNPTGSAISGQAITLKVYRVGGKLKAWFKQPNDYCTFKLEVAYGNNSSTPNVTLSNAAEPTGATEIITIIPNRVYSAAYKPTPADIGAANSSHGTHVTYATVTPKANGTAAIGSVNRVAREDHVHPLQTSVSGNAGTATKLKTARNINGTSFDGSANITTANWGTSRTITIGKTGKSVNGSGNVSWTMNEIMGAVSLSSSGTANKNKYIKFATVTLTKAWQCCSGKLALTNTEATASYGILHFYLRNGNAITTTTIELGWLTLNNSNYANRVYAVKVSDGKYDLYYRPYSDYETTSFTLLECNDPGLITLSAGSYKDSITAASTSSMKGVAASALKLTTARNIKIGNKSNSFDGSGNIEFTLADIGIGSSISAVASNLSGVTINGYDSMMKTINSNLGNL